jgi:glycine/D-amino acid oxidase-like deaminating enzyme
LGEQGYLDVIVGTLGRRAGLYRARADVSPRMARGSMMEHRPIPHPSNGGGAPASATLWSATAIPGPMLDRLAAQIETDVLVIGGGVAGLTTALHLAEADIDCVVAEAGHPGDGATGQSGGIVAPDYIRHTPETIGAVLGRQAAERLTRMIGGSAEQVFRLIDRCGIVCDAAQDGFYTPAHTERLALEQRRYVEQWRSRGYPVDFVEAEDAARVFGTDRYCGGLRFAHGGSLNPLSYARGLAGAAVRAGARVFAGTPVHRLQYFGGRWIAESANGAVSARRLVLAANGGNAALHLALRYTVLPLHVVQFATAPLQANEQAQVLSEGGAFTDKVPYLFTARLDGLGHLISAFPVSYLVSGSRAFHREAERRLRRHFATLPQPQIAFLWQGVAWLNPSFLPELYDLGDNALAIQACNGRGISINTALGIEVAAALVRGDRDVLSVRPRAPIPLKMYAGAALLPKVLMSMAYLSD